MNGHCHTPATAAHTVTGRSLILVGQPNVGKSALFNRLTGRYVAVSNYPGTTVEIARAAGRAGLACEVIDTPGVVTLPPHTDDERVTARILLTEPLSAVMQVGDAKNLRRTLNLAVQLAEMGLPMVLALNMMDEARSLEMDIDQRSTCRSPNSLHAPAASSSPASCTPRSSAAATAGAAAGWPATLPRTRCGAGPSSPSSCLPSRLPGRGAVVPRAHGRGLGPVVAAPACPLCGHALVRADAGAGCAAPHACAACGGLGCPVLRCPNCGYATIDPARSSWARRWQALLQRLLPSSKAQ